MKDIKKKNWPKGLLLRGESYRFRRRFNGIKFFETLGAMAENQAIEIATNFNFSIERGEGIKKAADREFLSIEEFFKEFLATKAHLQPSTIQRYGSAINNFIDYLQNHEQLDYLRIVDIDFRICQRFINYRSAPPSVNLLYQASKRTLKMERDVLAQGFKFAIKCKYIDSNPFEGLEVKGPSQDEVRLKHTYLTETEIDLLLKSAEELNTKRNNSGVNPPFQQIIKFSLQTGLRQGELCLLEWADIDVNQKVIHIRDKNVVENRVIQLTNKTSALLLSYVQDKKAHDHVFKSEEDIKKLGRRLPLRAKEDLLALKVSDINFERRVIRLTKRFAWQPKATRGDVPLSDDAIQILKELKLRSKSNFVFAHHDQGQCRIKLLELLYDITDLAGLPRMRWHDLRHTFAALLRSKGVSIETIKGILRHKSIKDTLIYAPYQNSEGVEAINKLKNLF